MKKLFLILFSALFLAGCGVNIPDDALNSYALPISVSGKTLIYERGSEGGIDGMSYPEIRIYDDCTAEIGDNTISVSEETVRKILYLGDNIDYDKKKDLDLGPDQPYDYVKVFDESENDLSYYKVGSLQDSYEKELTKIINKIRK